MMNQLMLLLFTAMAHLMFQAREMQVYSGQTFKVVLKSNHSTGYQWQWENRPKESIIDSVHADYILTDKALTGAGGHEIWEFRATKSGEQQLIMVYKRPWEKEGDFEKKEIRIRVITSEKH